MPAQPRDASPPYTHTRTQTRLLGASTAARYLCAGGVVPNLAMQAHEEAIERVVAAALSAAGVSPGQLSAVAVTVGPGLSLCLRVGVSKARQLSREFELPLVSVHHMEAHALVARLPSIAARAAPDAADVTTHAVAPGAAGAAGRPAGADAYTDAGAAAAPAASTAASTAAVAAAASTAAVAAIASTAAAGANAGTAAAAAAAAAPPTPVEAEASAASSSSSLSAAAAAAQPYVSFPFLCLLVSGGHNLLLLVRGVGDYVQVGVVALAPCGMNALKYEHPWLELPAVVPIAECIHTPHSLRPAMCPFHRAFTPPTLPKRVQPAVCPSHSVNKAGNSDGGGQRRCTCA
eukprot:366135-Chlamydomonas_euryale.AAC.9